MNKFTEDYFLNGPATGLSNYTDYRWMGQPTIDAAKAMMGFLGANTGSSVIDWGCARGYYVRALLGLGYSATGYDISEWAVNNCDPKVYGTVTTHISLLDRSEFVICKDVLEHVPYEELESTLKSIIHHSKKAALVIVPLAGSLGEYINKADRKDSTHVIRWTFEQWMEFIQRIIGDSVIASGAFRVPGVKDAATPFSTAFIKIQRI